MFYSKMIAGILFAGAITISGAFSFAAPDTGTGCPRNEPRPAVQTPVDPAKVQARIKNALDSLVKDGTISQKQENAVIKAFEAKRAQFEKERQELKKAGHPKDGKHSKKSLKERHGVLKDLVDDGVITAEQADAIRKAIRSLNENMKAPYAPSK